jgi:hypothetical protein
MKKPAEIFLLTITLLLFMAIFADLSAEEIRRGTDIKIVTKDSTTITGKWYTESSEVVCLKQKHGQKVPIDRSEISQVYKCRTLTNQGFLIGTLIGGATSIIIVHLTNDAKDIRTIWDRGMPYIAVGTSLTAFSGAILGSLTRSCEPIDVDLLYGTDQGEDYPDSKEIGLQLSFHF